MSQKKKENQLNVMAYYEWLATQEFHNFQEHHRYVSYQEQAFLQQVIYLMFSNHRTQFITPTSFPLVLKDYSTEKPMYVIDNNSLTIVFFSYNNLDDEMCWEVSVHIKDHNFCDERLLSFAKWFRRYYISDPRFYHIQMDGMPKEFLYPELKFYSKEVQDFCIEFWNTGRDFMLFKLFDLLRPF